MANLETSISMGSTECEDEKNKNRLNIYLFKSQDVEPKGTWPKSTNRFGRFYSFKDMYMDREF